MIFCVEDDESIQSLELYALRSAGFEVRGFMDGDSFLEALHADIGEGDPLTACHDGMLRQIHHQIIYRQNLRVLPGMAPAQYRLDP